METTIESPGRAIARLARTLFRSAVGSGLYAFLPFIGAGRADWPRAWLYAGVFVGASVVGSLAVAMTNPDLLAARERGLRYDTKAFDRLFYALFLPLMLAYPLVAGFDAGRRAGAGLSDWTAALGVVLFLAGGLLTTATLIVNRHAEATVRIQSDRGHRVISAGPYRLVRHPMYLGTLLGLPAAALVLGSLWSLAPLAVLVALFVWRTGREDRTLAAELPGYRAYMETTRFRLLPGVW